MRLIDADALKETVSNSNIIFFTDDILKLLDNAPSPTIFNREYSYRKPYPNRYIETIDNGAKMLRCPECRCQITAYPFSYAVGNRGYSFCPYCGTDMRKGGETVAENDLHHPGP